VFGGNRITDLGYLYLLFPALFGSLLHIFLAVMINNASEDEHRQYPLQWNPYFEPPNK
jgi:CBS-domain-containing membrane protein